MKITTERTGTLLDGKQAWLLAPQYEGGKKNSQRSRGDILHTERSLGLIALGISGSYNLKQTPLQILLKPKTEIEEAFIEGIRLDLLARKMPNASRLLAYPEASPKQPRSVTPLSPKTIFKLKCFLLRFRADVFGDELMEQGTASHPSASEFWERKAPEERVAVRFGHAQWPPDLSREWIEYKSYRCNFYYSGPGIIYRKEAIKEETFNSNQNMFNQYVRFCIIVDNLPNPTLLDLVDYFRFLRYQAWYFSQRSKGGYKSFDHLCVQLAVLSRYLAAAEYLKNPEYPDQKYPHKPDSEDPSSLWMRFYQLRKKSHANGTAEGKIVKSYVVEGIRPIDLLDLGISAWKSQPRMRSSERRLSSKKNMIYLRRRSAMFFILAPFMPIRARNWREMRWEKNLKRGEDGKWVIHFEGKELKVAMRKKGEELNIYHHELSDLASKWIDIWRIELSKWLLSDITEIEAVVPYVFPQRKNNLDGQKAHWGMTSYSGFRSGINTLSLDLKGHQFPPHQIRHIVATSLLTNATLSEAQFVADLLGDTLKTVTDTYFRLDTKEMRTSYFATLVSTAPQIIAQDDADLDELEATDD